MLGTNLLSCLIFPKIVARAFLSVILVLSCNFLRTYCSSGVHFGHFQVDLYLTVEVLTGFGFVTNSCSEI